MKGRRQFGLLGYKIGYTLSPRIFTALADLLGVSITFTVADVSPEKFPMELEILKTWDGFSVTIPYKETIIPRVARLSDEATAIGAVNSVIVENGRFIGHNTDAVAFVSAMRDPGIEGRRFLICGNGGAARAVAHGLLSEYPEADITVCGRGDQRVFEFITAVEARHPGHGVYRAAVFDEPAADEPFDLIVNCTPLGGVDHADKSPLPERFQFLGQPLCYDLVYRPAKTLFLRRAEAAGCRTGGGLSMLVRQAVASYTIWTGETVDMDEWSRQIMERVTPAGE